MAADRGRFFYRRHPLAQPHNIAEYWRVICREPHGFVRATDGTLRVVWPVAGLVVAEKNPYTGTSPLRHLIPTNLQDPAAASQWVVLDVFCCVVFCCVVVETEDAVRTKLNGKLKRLMVAPLGLSCLWLAGCGTGTPVEGEARVMPAAETAEIPEQQPPAMEPAGPVEVVTHSREDSVMDDDAMAMSAVDLVMTVATSSQADAVRELSMVEDNADGFGLRLSLPGMELEATCDVVGDAAEMNLDLAVSAALDVSRQGREFAFALGGEGRVAHRWQRTDDKVGCRRFLPVADIGWRKGPGGLSVNEDLDLQLAASFKVRDAEGQEKGLSLAVHHQGKRLVRWGEAERDGRELRRRISVHIADRIQASIGRSGQPARELVLKAGTADEIPLRIDTVRSTFGLRRLSTTVNGVLYASREGDARIQVQLEDVRVQRPRPGECHILSGHVVARFERDNGDEPKVYDIVISEGEVNVDANGRPIQLSLPGVPGCHL